MTHFLWNLIGHKDECKYIPYVYTGKILPKHTLKILCMLYMCILFDIPDTHATLWVQHRFFLIFLKIRKQFSVYISLKGNIKLLITQKQCTICHQNKVKTSYLPPYFTPATPRFSSSSFRKSSSLALRRPFLCSKSNLTWFRNGFGSGSKRRGYLLRFSSVLGDCKH